MALCMEISVLNNSIEIMYLHCFKLADFMIKKKKHKNSDVDKKRL